MTPEQAAAQTIAKIQLLAGGKPLDERASTFVRYYFDKGLNHAGIRRAELIAGPEGESLIRSLCRKIEQHQACRQRLSAIAANGVQAVGIADVLAIEEAISGWKAGAEGGEVVELTWLCSGDVVPDPEVTA